MPTTGKEKIVEIESENFICPNCGGVMKYDIQNQKFRCSSCKAESDIKTVVDSIKEYDFAKYHEREKAAVPFEGRAVVACQNCGSEIAFESYQVATTCPMCSSTQIATVKQRAGITPDGIIPFQVDKNIAQQKFRQWVKSRWFAPNDFKKTYGEGSLKGMYLPFWTYDAVVVSSYTGQGGKNRVITDKEGKTKVKTDWYPVAGVVKNTFDDVQVCASEKEANIRGILPYNTISNTKPYSTAYLSGYYAELYKIKADVAFNEGKKIMEDKMRELAIREIRFSYDEARISSIQSKYSNITYKHVLLPLWSSAFGYKGKTYNYLVNGESGRVTGDRPYSIPKIVAAVLVSAIIIVGIAVLTNQDEFAIYEPPVTFASNSAVIENEVDNIGIIK